MRLHILEKGHRLPQKMLLWLIPILARDPSQPPDIMRATLYRSDFFGKPFCHLFHDALRGPSSWSIAERELFGAFISQLNACRFCALAHGRITAEALSDTTVQAVLEEYHTAPISDKLKAMLGYLEKLTLSPSEIHPEDIGALYAVEIGNQAILEATYVCALFNIINRLADALDFAVPPSFSSKSAKFMLKHGYKFQGGI